MATSALSGCKSLLIRSVADAVIAPNVAPTYHFTKISNTYSRNFMSTVNAPYTTEIYGKIFFIGDISGNAQLAYYDSAIGYAKFITAASLGFNYTNVAWLAIENGKLFYVATDAVTTRQNMYRLNADFTATLILDSNVLPYIGYENPKSNDLLATAAQKSLFFVCTLNTFGNQDRFCRYQDGGTGFTQYPSFRTVDAGNDIGSFDFLNDDVYFDSYDDNWDNHVYRLRAGVTTRMTDTMPGAAQDYTGNINVVNGTVYFTANDAGAHMKLYKLDPVGLTVTQLSNTWPGWGDLAQQFTKVGNNLFYVAADNLGFHVYMSLNGAAVTKVSNTSAGGNDSPTILGYFYGKLYYTGLEPSGTSGRTYTMAPNGTAETALPWISPAGWTDNLSGLVAYNSKIYMSGYTFATGFTDLYSYDPAGNAFALIKSIDGARADSGTGKLVVTSIGVFLRASKTIVGSPHIIPFIMNSAESVSFMQGENNGDDGVGGSWYANGKLYLLKYDSELRQKLFEHDLSTGIETKMCDASPGFDDVIANLFASSGHIFVVANYQSLGAFKVVKCEAGVATRMSNTRPAGSDNINGLVQVGNKVYFGAADPTMKTKLYEFSHLGGLSAALSNTDPGGTDAIAATAADPAFGKVYFAAINGSFVQKVYAMDTTTHVVSQISNTGGGVAVDDNPQMFKMLSNKLYFLADSAGLTKMYRYDPAAPAVVTAPLLSIYPGNTDPIQDYSESNGNLYILTYNPTWIGTNLYQYNLSSSVLSMAYVINGTAYNNATAMSISNGILYFTPIDSSGYVSVHSFSATSNKQEFTSTANGNDQVLFLFTHSTTVISYAKDTQNHYRLHYYDGKYSGVVGKVNAALDDPMGLIPLSVPNFGLVVGMQETNPTYVTSQAYLWDYK